MPNFFKHGAAAAALALTLPLHAADLTAAAADNAAPPWNEFFRSWENGCTESADQTALLTQLVQQNSKTGQYKLGAVRLPAAYRAAVGKPGLRNQGEATSFTIPVTAGTYYGVPVASLEIYVGNDNGISGRRIWLNAPEAQVRERLKKLKVKFQKRVDTTTDGEYQVALAADRNQTALVCDFSN